MATGSAPERGDAVWLSFEPQAGREQSGRRPALVISPASYNAKSGLAIMCPITSQVKSYPFECAIPAGLPIQGVILSDQVRAMDWQARRAERICRLPGEVLDDVVAKICALIN